MANIFADTQVYGHTLNHLTPQLPLQKRAGALGRLYNFLAKIYCLILVKYNKVCPNTPLLRRRGGWGVRLAFILLYSLFTIPYSFSQTPLTSTNKKAIEAYQKGVEAIKLGNVNEAYLQFELATDKDSQFGEAYFQLARLYEMNQQLGQAIQNFEKCTNVNPPESYLAQAYYSLGNLYAKKGDYEKTSLYFSKLKETPKFSLFKQKSRVETMLASSNFAQEAIKKPLTLKQNPLPKTVNKFDSQYFPVLTADRETMIFTGYLNETNDENLYISNYKLGVWTEPESISENINSSKNEGTASISADGRILVFTACQDTRGLGSCDLYISRKNGNRWERPENLGKNVNCPSWDSQPSLSADGKTLYFVSDRKGGVGKRDIYVSKLDSTNNWGAAQNVGNVINTPEDDISPFIHANGTTLFFASEGHVGMGGQDLFSAELKNNSWTKPENLGYPLNTFEDQVGFFITSDGKKAYYSLEKIQEGRKRNALIYELEVPDTLQKRFKKTRFLKGIVYDAITKQKLAADIDLISLKTNQLVSNVASDETSGSYTSVLTDGGEYGVFVSKKGYFFKSLSFDFQQQADDKVLDIALEPIKKNSKEVLNNIYFETGRWDLKPESTAELDKLVKLLKANPELAIEISGHTDDVGKDAENQLLSQKRAKAVVEYLGKMGVNITKIKAEGYGKTRPIVSNTSEENKRLNRRIEVRVL